MCLYSSADAENGNVSRADPSTAQAVPLSATSIVALALPVDRSFRLIPPFRCIPRCGRSTPSPSQGRLYRLPARGDGEAFQVNWVEIGCRHCRLGGRRSVSSQLSRNWLPALPARGTEKHFRSTGSKESDEVTLRRPAPWQSGARCRPACSPSELPGKRCRVRPSLWEHASRRFPDWDQMLHPCGR